jgi:hypothetical protein
MVTCIASPLIVLVILPEGGSRFLRRRRCAFDLFTQRVSICHSESMNWSSFVPDSIVALMSAALAIAVALWTFRRDQAKKNKQLAHNLADDLASRRAFVLITPFEGTGGEFANRCFVSVQSAMERISAVRDEIRPNDRLRDELQSMVLACVAYKERTEIHPHRWQFALMDLRDQLNTSVRTLENILRLKPGSLPEPGTPHNPHLQPR